MISVEIFQQKKCRLCKSDFDITLREKNFLEKISPTFDEQKFQVPLPTLCPNCRQQRRQSFRNERSLYKRKCDFSGKDIVSIYSPNSPFTVYDEKVWWSDVWSPLDFGREFDATRDFFPQFQELYQAVPQMNLFVIGNENSDYTNMTARSKNCYFTFGSGDNEDCAYCRWLVHNQSMVDCNNSTECSFIYECIDSLKLSHSQFCMNCSESSNLYCCYDMVSCHDCIACSNLRNKSYCIFNKQYTKEEYQELKKQYTFSRELLLETYNTAIHREHNIFESENVSGDYIANSKNMIHGFDVKDAEDCMYVANAYKIDNCFDIDFQAENTSFCYDTIAFETAVNILFTFVLIGGKNVYYSISCFDCNDCFGCVSLRGKQYCILNKQYSKEEYEKKVAQILSHMQSSGEWGEFFPSSISPFGYNETVAMEYYPLTREEVLSPVILSETKDLEKQENNNSPHSSSHPPHGGGTGGSFLHGPTFNWSDYEPPFPKVEKIIKAKNLPKTIKEVPNDILNWAIECGETSKPFRITKLELDFYRSQNIAIPHKHPDIRHTQRMNLRSSRKLFQRTCDKCQKQIQTPYAPEGPERVYCEECYNKEVY